MVSKDATRSRSNVLKVQSIYWSGVFAFEFQGSSPISTHTPMTMQHLAEELRELLLIDKWGEKLRTYFSQAFSNKLEVGAREACDGFTSFIL